MKNITIFNNIINNTMTAMRSSVFTTAKISSQMNTYNSQLPKDEQSRTLPIICGETLCGNSIYERCGKEER